MHKPLIGIVAKPIANDYEDWWHFMGIVDDLRLRLIEQGAVVAGILPTTSDLHQQYHQELAHSVVISPHTKLAGILDLNHQTTSLATTDEQAAPTIMVNSIHTEVTYPDMVQSLTVAALCPDDHTVEAVELTHHRFLLGLKWHPELMPNMSTIFQAFVQACQNHQ